MLDRWTERKSAAELAAYRAEKNAVSIDGLPALAMPSGQPAREQRRRPARTRPMPWLASQSVARYRPLAASAALLVPTLRLAS